MSNVQNVPTFCSTEEQTQLGKIDFFAVLCIKESILKRHDEFYECSNLLKRHPRKHRHTNIQKKVP